MKCHWTWTLYTLPLNLNSLQSCKSLNGQVFSVYCCITPNKKYVWYDLLHAINLIGIIIIDYLNLKEILIRRNVFNLIKHILHITFSKFYGQYSLLKTREFPRPNLGPNIDPFRQFIPHSLSFYTFWWKDHENRTKNSKITDVYIYIMMQTFTN